MIGCYIIPIQPDTRLNLWFGYMRFRRVK